MQKSYHYTAYTKNGSKIRGNISAASEEIAQLTLDSMVKARSDIQFAELDSLNDSKEYDWDENLRAWQSDMFGGK